MQVLDDWNRTGVKKNFEDQIYFEKVVPFLKPSSLILEYGCGYGRILNTLKSQGFENVIGYDLSSAMIERGLKEHPELDLRLLKESGKIPLQNETIDAIILSTILCCIPDSQKQLQLIIETFRVLKPKGIIYLSDFLISKNSYFKEKYQKGFLEHGEWGVYTTSENLLVRHLSTKDVMSLLSNFDIQWFEQFDFKTMNNNPARTFHCVAQKN